MLDRARVRDALEKAVATTLAESLVDRPGDASGCSWTLLGRRCAFTLRSLKGASRCWEVRRGRAWHGSHTDRDVQWQALHAHRFLPARGLTTSSKAGGSHEQACRPVAVPHSLPHSSIPSENSLGIPIPPASGTARPPSYTPRPPSQSNLRRSRPRSNGPASPPRGARHASRRPIVRPTAHQAPSQHPRPRCETFSRRDCKQCPTTRAHCLHSSVDPGKRLAPSWRRDAVPRKVPPTDVHVVF